MPLRPPKAQGAASRLGSAASSRRTELRRGSARQRGYTTRWDKASKAYLRSHPLCEYCEVGAFGPPRVTAAALVDHLYPHQGDQVLFWLARLWVGSCTPCHSGPKQALERLDRTVIDQLALRLGRDPLPSL